MEDAVLEDSSTRLAKDCSMRAERQLHTMIVRLSGDFDLACKVRFQEELGRVLDGHTESLLLDLRGLDFIDSTGLRVLVHTDALARSDGIDFTVLCSDGQVRNVLQETGLDGVLPVVDPRNGTRSAFRLSALARAARLPPPPQPATAKAVSGTTAAVARKVMGLLRVMSLL
jgi:anti-sigma B factor antagonist